MAIIQNATCENQQVTIGKAVNIKNLFEAHTSKGPGIIVVGKVVEECKSAQLLA